MSVGAWGIAPSEFWRMSMQEWAWLFDVKKPRRTGEWAGRMTDDEVVSLSRALDEATADGKN